MAAPLIERGLVEPRRALGVRRLRSSLRRRCSGAALGACAGCAGWWLGAANDSHLLAELTEQRGNRCTHGSDDQPDATPREREGETIGWLWRGNHEPSQAGRTCTFGGSNFFNERLELGA
jgi:hypothetical protein